MMKSITKFSVNITESFMMEGAATYYQMKMNKITFKSNYNNFQVIIPTGSY